jgi:hypothetical protein
VAAEFVWTGESLVVLSTEELDELYQQLADGTPDDGPLRASEAEIVKVRSEYL